MSGSTCPSLSLSTLYFYTKQPGRIKQVLQQVRKEGGMKGKRAHSRKENAYQMISLAKMEGTMARQLPHFILSVASIK